MAPVWEAVACVHELLGSQSFAVQREAASAIMNIAQEGMWGVE